MRCRGLPDSGRAEDSAKKRKPIWRAGPSPPQLLKPDFPPDVAQYQHRDDDIVNRAEYGDEFRNEINWAQKPGEEPDQGQPGTERDGPVGEQAANQPKDVGGDPNELYEPGVSRTDDPQQRNEERPRSDEAQSDASKDSPVHFATLPPEPAY